MIEKEKNGVLWLEFELFQQFQNLSHGVFLKKGGVSTGQFSSLNLGFSTQDNQENILENLSRALFCLNLNQWERGRFSHEERVIALEDHSDLEFSFDGMATQKKDVGLVITHADCQAIILYDPVSEVVANIHSGWKGSILNILGKAVELMQERFFSKTKNIFAGISPSLGPDDAEFVHYKKEIPEDLWRYRSGKNFFNFWDISRMQLLKAGLRPEHIEIAGISTRRHPDFFSYRRDRFCGRNATIAAIR